MDKIITTIEQVVPVVAAEHAAYEGAASEEGAAEAALLDRVVALVTPALPALVSRILASESVTGIGTLDRERTKKVWSPYRGILVHGTLGAERDNPRDNAGNYCGVGIFLATNTGTTSLPADGGPRFVLARYSGTWSRWQGASCEWEATFKVLTTTEVARHVETVDVVGRLAGALAAQLRGSKPERTKAMLENAKKLRALADLI